MFAHAYMPDLSTSERSSNQNYPPVCPICVKAVHNVRRYIHELQDDLAGYYLCTTLPSHYENLAKFYIPELHTCHRPRSNIAFMLR